MEVLILIVKELGIPLVLGLIRAGANAPNSPMPTKHRGKLNELLGDRFQSEDALDAATKAGGHVR